MKKLLAVAVLATLAIPALAIQAEPIDLSSPTFSQHVQLQGSPSRSVVYDNTTTLVSGYAPTGSSGMEIGDEIQPDKTSCGGSCSTLDSISWSVYNSSAATATLSTVDCVIRIYDTSAALAPAAENLCATLNFGTLSPNLAAGHYTTYTASDLAEYGMCCPDIMTITVQLTTSITGAKPGQIVATPPTVGASGDYIWKDTGWIWFNGNPTANLYYAVGCVPEPTSMLLLGLAGLFIRRR